MKKSPKTQINPVNFLGGCLLALGILAGPVLTANKAFGADLVIPRSKSTEKSNQIFFGTAIKENSYHVFGGVVTAFNGDLNQSGILTRIYGSFGGFDYSTVSVPGGEVDVSTLSGDLMIGYQYFEETYRLTGYIGINAQHRDYSPSDPNNQTMGTALGFKVQGEARTTRRAPFYTGILAHYSTANEAYFSRGRLGVYVDSLTVGAEGVLLGNRSFDAKRVGAYISGIPFGKFNMTLAGGYSDSNDSESGDGPYINISYGMRF